MFKILITLIFSFSVMAETRRLDSAQSLGASFSTAPKTMDAKVSGYSVQLIYTGAPVGTFSLECSNDGANWDTVPDTTVAISAAGTTLYNVAAVFYKFARIKFVRTSGTGSMDAYFFGME